MSVCGRRVSESESVAAPPPTVPLWFSLVPDLDRREVERVSLCPRVMPAPLVVAEGNWAARVGQIERITSSENGLELLWLLRLSSSVFCLQSVICLLEGKKLLQQDSFRSEVRVLENVLCSNVLQSDCIRCCCLLCFTASYSSRRSQPRKGWQA